MKLTFALVAMNLPFAALAFDKVIYGVDNRYDVFEYPYAKVVEASRSTVALFKSYDLTNRGGNFQIDKTPIRESANVCSVERFSKQPAAAFCSGFLIAPDKMVTAGHCITTQAACDETRFVFDYKMNTSNNAQVNFKQSQIYSCKKVLGQVLERGGADFAVIQLDRVVPDRKPLTLSDNKSLSINDEVLVIGHPSGLPTKITDSGRIRKIDRQNGFFVTNLDTYGGNSGSAVFNTRTLEVEGILVRGETDYETDGDCERSFRTDENSGRGEDVTLISVIRENGFEGGEETDTDGGGSTDLSYVWLNEDQTCNLFVGVNFVREVENSLCADAPAPAPSRYMWMTDNTCNEFNGQNWVQEVADNLCPPKPGTPPAPVTSNVRYMWMTDNTCNEFNGINWVREVADHLCGPRSNSN